MAIKLGGGKIYISANEARNTLKRDQMSLFPHLSKHSPRQQRFGSLQVCAFHLLAGGPPLLCLCCYRA